MPYRRTLILNDNYYHIFNHSLGKALIFGASGDPSRMLSLWQYYHFSKSPMSYSKFNRLESKLKTKFLSNLKEKNELRIEIISFCLMPNHYHLLLKQVKKNGIKNFIADSQNSYAKYFNLKNARNGPLFRGRFQSVSVNNDNQLLHLSRYIHLNPYSSQIIKTKDELSNYPWSSLSQYLKKKNGFCQPRIVLDQFNSPKDYQSFVFDQADYQQHLDLIKHLALE